jgi:hypothetical protein
MFCCLPACHLKSIVEHHHQPNRLVRKKRTIEFPHLSMSGEAPNLHYRLHNFVSRCLFPPGPTLSEIVTERLVRRLILLCQIDSIETEKPRRTNCGVVVVTP